MIATNGLPKTPGKQNPTTLHSGNQNAENANENSTNDKKENEKPTEKTVDEKLDDLFQQIFRLVSYSAYLMAKDIVESEVNILVEKKMAERMLNEEVQENSAKIR